MRKKIWKLVLLIGLIASMTMTAYAETSYGSPDWSVVFSSDKKMVSNFKTSDLDEVIYGIQPGDDVVITLALKNEDGSATDWYMTNKVLYSLEDRSADKEASGGAYTYRLTYTAPDGTVTALFDSDTIGGDSASAAGEGLRQATDALDDYFYLDTLGSGQSGKVMLEVALDGDTQGNAYQDTLADLQMNFAVEMNASGSNASGGGNSGTGTRGSIVKTGDEMTLTPFIITACVTGTLLLIFAFYSQAEREKEKQARERRRGTV